jgi:hypothetical protein
MQTTDFDTVKARIASLDLEPIKFKLVKEQGFKESDVEQLEKWYKRFLFLTFKYNDRPIVVSEAIDNFWHQHILDTRKYAEDCEELFGKFLHHFPYFGLRGEDDERALHAAYAETISMMKEEYGETPENVPNVAKDPTSNGRRLPSLCSDCGGGPSIPTGYARPRLAVSPSVK